MRAGIVVNVTRADRLRLEAIVADRSAPQKHVWRAKVIVATADGCGTAEIMRPPRSGSEWGVRPLPGFLTASATDFQKPLHIGLQARRPRSSFRTRTDPG